LALSRRLERTEGMAGIRFARARQQLSPQDGAAWTEFAGMFVVYDGADSPITQTFGLGLYEGITPEKLTTVEGFFLERKAPVQHEVSPLVGQPTLALLAARNYRPFEISSVMYRPIEPAAHELPQGVTVRVVSSGEAELWSATSARAWTHDHPEYLDFFRRAGAAMGLREGNPGFLADIDGQPAAAASLSIVDGVALFAGAATVFEFRRRGLQNALLHERMRYALERGCDLAMIVTEPGGDSQRNAERHGFRVAYTRIKWKLEA
jgi:hypothetical protein